MKIKFIILIIFSGFFINNIVFAESVRKPVVEGRFYPSQKLALNRMVKQFLDEVDKEKLNGKLIGLIVPHAGYVYSGKVATYAYKQIQGKKIDTVILLGPSHKVLFNGVSVGNYDKYTTVLGNIPVDKELAEVLMKEYKMVKFLPKAHEKEHSLEVQLPFLQTVLENFRILPLVISKYDINMCKKLSEILYKLSQNKKVIFIASSDLSHYHSYKQAIDIDKKTIEGIKRLDAKHFLAKVKQEQYELCGAGPVGVLLSLAEHMEDVDVQLLNYSNSGEVSMGGTSRVVGYSAMALIKRGVDMDEKQHSEDNSKKNIKSFDYLNEEEKKIVLNIAKESIKNYLTKKEIPEFDYREYPHLNDKRGVFVTIYKNGMLRGCIGKHESNKPLYKLIPEIAVASAFNDRRFTLLKKEELDDISLEVSVYLSKLVKIEDISQYKIGEHGIILKRGFRAATYLPKVPVEQKWDKEETLRHLCYKAGLPVDAWKDKNTEFYVYATQVVKEK